MTDPNTQARLVAVASQLRDKTARREAQWERTDDPDVFLYGGKNAAVTISKAEGQGARYQLRVLDAYGTEVDSLEAENNALFGRQDPYYSIFAELYAGARRSALDVDGVIDGLLAELTQPPPDH